MMAELINKIGKEIIYGGHLLAVGPAILVAVVSRHMALPYSLSLLIVVYLITYIVYGFDRYLGQTVESSTERINHQMGYRSIMPVIFVISIALIVTLLIDKGTIVIISALLLLLIGISYTLFFKGLTKSVVGFKNYYVALTYVSIIIYTAIYHSAPLNSKLIILTMFFAMRWFINTAFCDIKDIAQDKNEGLKTLPVVLGQKSFLFTLGAINALSVIPLMVGVATGILPPSILFLVIVVPYYYYYSSLINNKKTDLQKITNVWADGEVLLWLVAAL